MEAESKVYADNLEVSPKEVIFLKFNYSEIKDLAKHFISGQIDPNRWENLDDEAVIEELTQVRGIGRWTAEMFLIFNLLRPDVFPLDDIGLLNALGLSYNDGQRVTKAQASEIAQTWQPWRTVASWYFWRSLDPLPVEY